MSGHSKWHNIQAKKGKTDAARAKVFTKLGKELMVAAKENPNIETNSKLKDVVAKAKSANMPTDNIMRAIKKASGELNASNYEEVIYEGYGPNGTAFVVTALTDNKNRTAANVRHAFDRNGGNMGTSGSVMYMFNRKGQIIINREEIDEEELMMTALDNGADDFITDDEEVFEIVSEVENFSALREALENAGYEFEKAELTYLPNLYTSVDSATAPQVQKLIDKLEEDDDVSDVYHNTEFPEDFEG